MNRVKLISLLMPVLAATVFLWFKRRKKKSITAPKTTSDPGETNDDETLKISNESPSDPSNQNDSAAVADDCFSHVSSSFEKILVCSDDADSGTHSSSTPPLDPELESENGCRDAQEEAEADPIRIRHRSKRRQRDSASTSITSNGSDCENWRENMGRHWEPLDKQLAPKNHIDDYHPNSATLRAATANPDRPTTYEFEFPSELCGRLIGRGGRNLYQLMSETNTQLAVRKQTLRPDRQIVTVQGRHADVQRLLQNVRLKFPKHHYAHVDLRPVNLPPPVQLTAPDLMNLYLPDGTAIDVSATAVVSAGHLFLHLPTHPTYPNLPRLDACMMACYGAPGAPQLPVPVEPFVICAAPESGGWFRAQVVTTEGSGNGLEGIAQIRFVDYGGYASMPIADLRQIRSDFIMLPFQAVECYMANLAAPGGGHDYPAIGIHRLAEMTKNALLQAEVVGYAEDGVPCVNLYKREVDETRTFINEALVSAGVAVWFEQNSHGVAAVASSENSLGKEMM